MQTKKARWMQDADGTWISFLVSRQEAAGAIESMEDGKTYDLTLKPHRERRSLDANAYFWVLLDRLAGAVSIPKTEIYRRYIKEIGGNSETVCVVKKRLKSFARDGRTTASGGRRTGCPANWMAAST